jgi:hypothetical protein
MLGHQRPAITVPVIAELHGVEHVIITALELLRDDAEGEAGPRCSRASRVVSGSWLRIRSDQSGTAWQPSQARLTRSLVSSRVCPMLPNSTARCRILTP